jgi:hypothetical protein
LRTADVPAWTTIGFEQASHKYALARSCIQG